MWLAHAPLRFSGTPSPAYSKCTFCNISHKYYIIIGKLFDVCMYAISKNYLLWNIVLFNHFSKIYFSLTLTLSQLSKPYNFHWPFTASNTDIIVLCQEYLSTSISKLAKVLQNQVKLCYIIYTNKKVFHVFIISYPINEYKFMKSGVRVDNSKVGVHYLPTTQVLYQLGDSSIWK